MKYISEEKFKEATKNYADNYDRIFREPEEAVACEERVGTIANVVIDDWSGEPIVAHVQVHEDNTGMTCRNSGKACTLEDLDHHACYTCNKLLDACKRLP